MTREELIEYRDWFWSSYPNSKLVLRRTFVVEWRKTKLAQSRKAYI